MVPNRREFTAGALAFAATTSSGEFALASSQPPALILRKGRITTLDKSKPRQRPSPSATG
jgi:hypothetical protein